MCTFSIVNSIKVCFPHQNLELVTHVNCEKKVENKSGRETKKEWDKRERKGQKNLFVTANRCKELARR